MADKIRLINDGPWTHLPNKTIRDRRLSLRTLGLLLLMHSLPDDWDYTVAGLATICGLHRETVGKALKELEAAGYLSRHQTHGERGVFGGCEYVVSTVSATDEDEPDAPQTSGTLETAETIEGERGQPLPEIPTTVTPSSVLPSSVKPTQRKNKELICRCNLS